jgi:hypothetical protein
MTTFERISAYLTGSGVAHRIRRKSESWLMGVIGALLFFNRSFMTEYTTTIGSTVYFPDQYYYEQPVSAARTLAHEGVHIKQSKRVGAVWFALTYLFPLPLAALALGAVLAFWWLPALGFLGFLVFLAPLPAPWRVKYEREAYIVTAVCDAAQGWDISADWYLDYMVSHYCGWGYYKPAWNAAHVRKLVRQDMELALKLFKGEVRDEYVGGLVKVLKA